MSKHTVEYRYGWRPSINYVLSSLILFSMSGYSQNISKHFAEVVGRSNFIFSGTIVTRNASNIQANSNGPVAIVKVDEVIDAPPEYFKVKGYQITILLTVDTSLTAGTKAVFYTTAWYFGKTLGVREIKNNLGHAFQPGLAKQIEEAREKIADDSLRAKLKRTSLIVRGKVIAANLDSLQGSRILSEHNPYYRRASIKVTETLKGQAIQKSDSVYYASSYDYMWVNSPKLSADSTGIFLLRKRNLRPFLNRYGYVLIDPADFQPDKNLNKIKTLLK